MKKRSVSHAVPPSRAGGWMLVLAVTVTPPTVLYTRLSPSEQAACGENSSQQGNTTSC